MLRAAGISTPPILNYAIARVRRRAAVRFFSSSPARNRRSTLRRARETRDLTEAVRRIVVPQQFRHTGAARIRPLIFAPDFDAELTRMWSNETGLAPDPHTARHVRNHAERFLADAAFAPHAVLVSATLRPLLAEFFERVGPRLDVFAFGEIPPEVSIEPAVVCAAPFPIPVG